MLISSVTTRASTGLFQLTCLPTRIRLTNWLKVSTKQPCQKVASMRLR
ncbi:hypothetical protein EVA_16246 [gut metagenome]|uniref:Uncharacterized protein n=1 Tax=gut metagenome TaxID=749906 RepID=J9FL77_9ZZZZ